MKKVLYYAILTLVIIITSPAWISLIGLDVTGELLAKLKDGSEKI